ncbi:hypothetical protein GPALN_010899, partial [Globodera pallida]
MPFERSKIEFVIFFAFLVAISAHQIGVVIKNVVAKHQPLSIQMFCFSSFGQTLLGRSTICHYDDRKIDIKTVVNLSDANKMMDLCKNSKLFIRVEEAEKNFENEKQPEKHSKNEVKSDSLPANDEEWAQIESEMKLEYDNVKNMSQIADELLESEDDLSPSWVKVSKNLDEFEEMGDKKSATNWQQIAKIDDQSAPFLKLFELNVLQLIGTDTIILDVVAALSLTMTIRAQNGGVHDEKILVNEAGDDRYCVLLYCYKMTAETPDHQQKELVIFGNPTVDGNVPSSGGDQKVVINVELGNLDELPNCQNDELFIYIERARFGDEHTKPTTAKEAEAKYKPKQRRIDQKIIDSLFGGLKNSLIRHDKAINNLNKLVRELCIQMMFAAIVELEHLKEVLKLVLFMKQILQIVKDDKEKVKHTIEHLSIEQKKIVGQMPAHLSAVIAAEEKKLRNLRIGQRKIKKDLLEITVAKERADWTFLHFVENRNSRSAAYCRSVIEWLTQTVQSQPGDQVDKWEFVNDAIMEWQARGEFIAVASNAMRNYAALSEAMDLEEINGYFNEVLMMAVFLREFYKSILPQNPDETQKKEAGAKCRNIEEQLNEKEKNVKEQQKLLNLDAEQAELAADQPPVPPLQSATSDSGTDSSDDDNASVPSEVDSQRRNRRRQKRFDNVRAQPDMPFRKVLEKLDAKCARTENDADAHFFNAAFKKWMDITLTSNLTNLPNYVTKEGNVRQAETRMERMLTVVQLEARREFQKVANRFLPQYLLLTKAMTEHEVRECARQINWFHAVNVMIDPLQVNSNGTWLKNEGLRVGGFRSKSTTWLRTVPGLASGTLGPQRCQKGIATQFESNEAGASFHTEASQISAAAVATGDESESARYCSWALGDTTASDMHDMDSDVMAGGRAHSTEIASSDEIISSSDEKYQDDLKQPNYDSGSRSSRQNSFERQQSLSSQRDKRPLLGQLSDLPSEAVSISSPQHTLSDSSSQYSLSSTKSTVRAPVRPAPTIPRHRAGSDTDTSVDNAKKIGKSVAGGGSGRSATLKKKNSLIRHDKAIIHLNKIVRELCHQMMFAAMVELEHLKEVLKLVLFMKQILQIVKDDKEKVKHTIEHLSIEQKQIVGQMPAHLSAVIAAEAKKLTNLRIGQRKIKKDLFEITVAKERADWTFLHFVENRNSSCATYCCSVIEWLTQTVQSQPGDQVDKWEFINGHLNGGRVNWKIKQTIKDGFMSSNLEEIKNNPSLATQHFLEPSLLIIRADAIMEWQARGEFIAVASNAMRNYAALSEAMDLEEINGYFNLFETENYLHPAIICIKKENKKFDNKFEQEMDNRNFDEKPSTDEHSTFVARFVNKNVVYSKKSEEWHTKQIEQIIEEYSYKALMALTRDERNRKMEVLMMAVFLREFYKSILPQNPDETQKKEAGAKCRNIKEQLTENEQKVKEQQKRLNHLRRQYKDDEKASVDAEQAELRRHKRFDNGENPDAESDLIDLISQRDERNAALKKAKQNLKKAENSYQRARKMAKKMLAYLDEVRAQPDMTFRKVLQKMRDQCARTENDADAHFFNAAFLKWMDITLAMNVTNLPNYVTEEGKVRPAETDMERMLAVVQLEARRDFQKVANRFLPQYLLLTKAMTEHEVVECARQINWFHAVNVMIDTAQVKSNGTWLRNEERRVGDFGSKSTTWLRTVPGLASGKLGPQRCQKGFATQFASNEAGSSFRTEASQTSAAAVATGDESESARWTMGDTTASDMHDMDSDVMAGGRAHSTEIASSDEIISSSDEKDQDDLKQPNYDSGSRSSRQNSFERQQSLSSQRGKRPLLGQLSDLPSEAVSISSPQHALSDSSSQYSLSSTKSIVRAPVRPAPVRPAPTIPRQKAGSDTDTSVDNAKKTGKSVAGGESRRSATLKKKMALPLLLAQRQPLALLNNTTTIVVGVVAIAKHGADEVVGTSAESTQSSDFLFKRGALSSKSGQSVADEILPSDGTDNKSSSWFDNIKRTLKPPSRLTHDEVIETVRTHQQRLALEVVLAQNVKQLHTRKELLKMALFYEQTLNLFSSVRGGEGLTSQKVDNEHVDELEKRIKNLRQTKRAIKDSIDKFGEWTKNIEEFNFGKEIKSWERVRKDVELSEVLKNWERKKPDDWDKYDLKIWMQNNTKTKSEQNAHPLLQHAIKIDTRTKKLVDRILLVDAAFDREARNLCLNAAFVVPMRNWAQISQKMTDEQIEEYVTNVLGNNFFGLQITFDSSIASTFDESADFEPIEESKKKSLLKTFKHNLRTAVRPYSSRSPETHLKELEAKNTKLSWDILKAINQEKRIKAQESIKLAVYLMMSINIAHSAEVEAKIDEAKKAVAGQSRALKDAEKKHKHAHCCSSSSHNSQDERNLSRNSSRRRQKRNPTDEDSESDDDVKKGDDGENGEDGESDDDVKKSEDGENGEDGESDDDVKKGEDGENGEDGESAEDVESDEDAESDEDVESDEDEHFDNDEEEQNSDSDPSSSPMFASGSFNRKGKESRAMSPLTKSRSYSSNRSTSGHNSVSSGSPKLKRCPTKQKVIENQVMLAKSKSQRDELIKSQKAVKNARQYLHLKRTKSGRGFFGVSFDAIKTEANGNEVYKVINGQILEIAKQQLPEVDRLDDGQVEKLVEKHMREVFAKGPGKQFLLNMIELSKQLTVFEIRRCVEKFSWFRGFKVQINKKQFTLNGRGKEPPVRPQTTGEHQYNLVNGTSSAVGTASTIGTFKQQHHHRRWRRGSAPSFGSLGRSAFRSKSGRRVADEILPSDGTDNKSPSWFDNIKRTLKPASRLTHAEAIAKVRTHQRRYAFEVVLAQNVQQLHQRKEMLKATLFFEQTLNLFSNELVTQQANLQNGKDGLKQLIKQKSAKKAAESKNKSKGAKSEENKKQNKKKGVKSEEHKQPEPQSYGNMQKGLVGTLKDRITKIRAIKRKIKEIIDDFDMFENKEDFNFATSIYSWGFVRNHKEISEVLNDWEAKKPDDWGKNNLKIWMRNNTKSDDDEKAHALYNLAKANKNDTKTTNLVNQILLVDAAFDREARNLCLNAAFVVPMRNWAEISQKMTDEQIEEYVTNVLGDNFLGLQITFDSSIASTFDESADFEPVEESKKKSLLKTFKHNLRTAVRPYSSRGLETHLKQLEVKNTKLSWDILKAMSELERINAKESVKLAVYLMMLIEKAYSDEVTQKIEEAKNKVASQKREVKKAEKEHKRAHSRHNSPEHKMTRNKSVRSSKGQRRRKRDGKHDGNDYDNDYGNDGGNDDLGGNEAEPLDGDDDYQSGSFDDEDDEEGSDDDNFEQQANAKLEKCASKQKVEESRAKLAKSKSQHDELLKSKKAVK